MLQDAGFESPFAEVTTEARIGSETEAYRSERSSDDAFRAEATPQEYESFGEEESVQDELYEEYSPQSEDETFPSGLTLGTASGATGPGQEHWDPTGTNLPLLDTGPAARGKKVSANFTVGELVTSGDKSADVARISPALVQLLQAIRSRVATPVTVVSGYRSWKRNGVVYKGYGKPPTLSQHCAGKAADIKIAGMTGMDIAKVAIDVWGPRVALGIGPNYAHVDVRGRGDSWTYFGKGNLEDSNALRELAQYRKHHQGGGAPTPTTSMPPTPLPLVPGTTKGGNLLVRSLPLLTKHRGTPPDLVLTWNAMTRPTEVDIIVHLHGFSRSAAAMPIDTEKLPISGLDLRLRVRPTLAVLPRGNFYGGLSGEGYDFPALTTAGALDRLISDALARFTSATQVSAPRGRLLLTAHSGGGKALLAILNHCNPDEVFVFDGLYQPATALAQWAAKRIPSDPYAAMRVFYRAGSKKHPGTEPASEALGRTLSTLLVATSPNVQARFRVERTSVDHGTVPRRYGADLLGDAGADVANARRFPFASSSNEAGERDAEEGWLQEEDGEVETNEGFGALEAAVMPEYEVENGEEFADEAFEHGEDLLNHSVDSEQSEPGQFELDQFDPEAFEPETFEPPRFEAKQSETEYLQLAGNLEERAHDEGFEPEEFDAEYLLPADSSLTVEEQGAPAGEYLSWDPEAEDENLVTSTGASVVFPSGYALPYAPAGAASDPANADPHGTGLPLLAVASASLRRPLSKNFTVQELTTLGGVQASVARVSPELVRVLQAIRDRVARPVRVDSGYRPNGLAVAARDTESRHTSGQAADIRVTGMGGEELARLAIDAGGPKLGIGIAQDCIHVDVRGTWKLWTVIPGQPGRDAMGRIQLHQVKLTSPTPPTPNVDARFFTIKNAILAAPGQAERARLLEAGIAFARSRASAERRNAGRPDSVTARTRATIMGETGIGGLDQNVLFGRVNDDRVEDAYRAWFENPSHAIPPWVLLGVWAKEGLTTPQVSPQLLANDAADARSIWRSNFFFVNMGTDHYVQTITVPGADNRIVSTPGSGVQHDVVYTRAIAAQVAAGLLPRDISAEIDAQLTVIPTPGIPGDFTVTPTRRFAVLSLMLVDAFWRESQADVAREVKPTPSEFDFLGVTYMKWNMRLSSWRQMLARDMKQNVDSDGTVPSLAIWALHRRLNAGQFVVPRTNALRAQLNFRVYRSVYQAD